MSRIVKLQAAMPGTPAMDQPKPERLLQGNPQRQTWNLVDEALPAGHVDCGIWQCEPGHWRIAFGPTQRELFTVIAGRCRIHDAQAVMKKQALARPCTCRPALRAASRSSKP